MRPQSHKKTHILEASNLKEDQHNCHNIVVFNVHKCYKNMKYFNIAHTLSNNA